MKSDVYVLGGNGKGIEEALDATEKTAQYGNLTPKQALHLRLLAEELTGIMRGIAGDYQAKFWIEKTNNTYSLHLKSVVDLNTQAKEHLISVSSKSKIEAPAGIMGKIGSFFRAALQNYKEVGQYCNESGVMLYQDLDMMSFGNGTMTWSLQFYRTNVQKKKKKEQWDELEKSIIANLADDVAVCLDGKAVEIVVRKEFEPQA